MKILTTKFNQLVLLSIACILAASTPMKAQQVITHSGKANSGETARLIVNRAANFGTEDSINLFVDGTQVAVTQGQPANFSMCGVPCACATGRVGVGGSCPFLGGRAPRFEGPAWGYG